MEITVSSVDTHSKELLINAPWEMVESDYNDLLKRYSKLAIRGFRPGKTPIGLIESHFKNELKNDLLTVTSTRLCRKALKEKGLVSGSPIEITESELRKNEYIQFKAGFIEMPQFELPDYRHLDLKSEELEGKLDEISEKLLEQTAISLHESLIENELKYSEQVGEVASDAEVKAAEDRVKLMLILKKIANQDSIEVDDKDIEARIETVAIENEVTPAELKDFLVANGGVSRLAESLLAETVLGYIISVQEPIG